MRADRTPQNYKRKHGVESAGPLSQNGGPANSLFVLQKHSVSFTKIRIRLLESAGICSRMGKSGYAKIHVDHSVPSGTKTCTAFPSSAFRVTG